MKKRSNYKKKSKNKISKRRSKRRNARSKRKSRKLKKDGVKKSNFLLPLLASSFLGSSEALYKEPSRFLKKTSATFNEYSCSITPDSIFYKEGETDLNFAIKNGNNECAKFLITDSTVNEKNRFSETPLSAALYSDNYEIAEYLIEHGADVNTKSLDGRYPLTETSNLHLIKLLLENGAIIDYNDPILHGKIIRNFHNLNKEYIKLFIEYGLDLTLKDDNGIPLYIYSMLSNIFVIYGRNIIDDLLLFLSRRDVLKNIFILIGIYGLGNVLFLFYVMYKYYKYYNKYIPPIKIKKINIRLFKSLESIEKIVENINLVNMLNDKLIYPDIIGFPLLHFITMLYFNYKHKNSCNYAMPLGDKVVFTLLRQKNMSQNNLSIVFNEEEKNIEVPIDFWTNFKKCVENPQVIFIIFNLTLKCKDTKYLHANYLIYNKKDRSLERFEPHGSREILCGYLGDDLIIKLFNEDMGTDFIKEYYKPLDFCPSYSVQSIENFENNDPQGFCATWCYFYVDLRLSNPDIDRKDLVNNMIYQITYNEKSFTKFIKEYSIILVQIYNKVLERVESGEKLEDIYSKIINDFTSS